LKKNQNSKVRVGAAVALGSAFSHITDKSQATNRLLALTKDPDSDVRYGAAIALGSAFTHVTDKSQATDRLLALTKDPDRSVRWGAAVALGSAFSHITDKSQATTALLALTKDMYSTVRAYANHSLGKVYVFKATEADNENFKKELEKALEFFEKSSQSSQEQVYSNPSKFCFPFYISFYSITYKKYEAEAEIKNFLAEAESAVGDSESKDRTFDAVEKLSNALQEVLFRDVNRSCIDISARKTTLQIFNVYYTNVETHLIKFLMALRPFISKNK
jgi:HEAT repeat protein